jgi:triosephosphate isomerase
MRRLFIAGNWKMNTTRADGVALAQAVSDAAAQADGVEVLVAPPFPYLIPVGAVLSGSRVWLGAQNCWPEPPGAFTGEVAAEMLVDCGCSHVILGHSERRHVLGESDALINRKVRRALEVGLKVILCVGETLDDREGGRTESVLDAQMEGGLDGVGAAAMAGVVIAYEPVWAIGTGRTATPDQAESAHRHLRNWLAGRYNPTVGGSTQIQYGGSVKADNAAELLGQADVDGALVGGASLKADQFAAIIRAAAELSK